MKALTKVVMIAMSAMLCNHVFAYNGGYENGLMSDTTIGGVTYKGYGNNTVTAREESGTTIAANKYAQCKKLKSVNLTGVTSIGNAAFAYSALESVTIPSTLTSIGYIAFGGCSNLTSVTVDNFNWYNSSSDAGKEPFRDCSKLTTLVANCAPPSWDVKGVFANLTTIKCRSANVSAWKTAVPSATVSEIVPVYTVVYHKNDGTTVTASQVMNCGSSQSLKWVNSGLGWTNPAGKTFLGWSVAATSGVVKYSNGASVKDLAGENKVCNLYAVWYDPKTDYIVKYYRNAGSTDKVVAMQRKVVGVASALAWKDSELGWTWADHTFIGWGTAANSTVAKYVNGESVSDLTTAGKTMVLYAVWRSANTYVVTFHRNTSSTDKKIANQWMACGTTTALAWKDSALGWANPTGYTFAGWATSASGAVVYANGAKVKDIAAKNGTRHLYAKWTANKYKVRFHYNCGTDKTADQSFAYGTEQRLTYLDSGLKWAHPQSATFLGWSTTADGDVKYANGAKVKNLTATNNGVVHLYAKWALITVRYHYNYGTDKTAVQYFKQDVAQRLLWKDSGLKWATPAGKLFVGWGIAKNAVVAKYANGESVKNLAAVGKTLEIYAVWTVADSYIVKYYRNYSSSDTTVAYQGIARTVATRLAWKDSALGWANPSGKTFLGWSKTRTATKGTYANGQSVTGLGSKGATVALYAVWGSASKVSAEGSGLMTAAMPSQTSNLQSPTFAAGYYHGTFADGSGTFDLLLDEFDEDGVATAYFAATTENGTWSEECEATVVGDKLVVTVDDVVYLVVPTEEGACEAQRVE